MDILLRRGEASALVDGISEDAARFLVQRILGRIAVACIPGRPQRPASPIDLEFVTRVLIEELSDIERLKRILKGEKVGDWDE
jgi:hypothetical protein